MAARVACLVCGVFLNGVATGAYIGAGLGPGPRDGLMTGLAARGHSIRVVRTGLEVTVLATGWLLGGTVGVGTVVYALVDRPAGARVHPALRARPADAGAARWRPYSRRRARARVGAPLRRDERRRCGWRSTGDPDVGAGDDRDRRRRALAVALVAAAAETPARGAASLVGLAVPARGAALAGRWRRSSSRSRSASRARRACRWSSGRRRSSR